MPYALAHLPCRCLRGDAHHRALGQQGDSWLQRRIGGQAPASAGHLQARVTAPLRRAHNSFAHASACRRRFRYGSQVNDIAMEFRQALLRGTRRCYHVSCLTNILAMPQRWCGFRNLHTCTISNCLCCTCSKSDSEPSLPAREATLRLGEAVHTAMRARTQLLLRAFSMVQHTEKTKLRASRLYAGYMHALQTVIIQKEEPRMSSVGL